MTKCLVKSDIRSSFSTAGSLAGVHMYVCMYKFYFSFLLERICHIAVDVGQVDGQALIPKPYHNNTGKFMGSEGQSGPRS
jgi:hypothetical protein